MSSKEKIRVIEKTIDLQEAKTEHVKVKGKWDEKLIHQWSMFAIKVGIFILALAIVIVILVKGR